MEYNIYSIRQLTILLVFLMKIKFPFLIVLYNYNTIHK